MAEETRTEYLITEGDEGRLNGASPANNNARLGSAMRRIVIGQISDFTTNPKAVTVPGFVDGDLVIASIGADDGSSTLGGVINAEYSAANTIEIKTLNAPTGNDGVINYIAFPTG